MAFTPIDRTNGVSEFDEAEWERLELGIADAHTLAATAQTRADDAYALASEAGGGGGTGGIPIRAYTTFPLPTPSTPGVQLGINGDSASEGLGDIWEWDGAAWQPTGVNIRGAEGVGTAGTDGKSWLPINFQIDGEVQPTTDALGMPAPFNLVAKKLILRLIKPPQTGPIKVDVKADGASLFTTSPDTRPVIPIGGRMLKVDLDQSFPEDTVFTFEAVETGAPGASGTGGAPALSATDSFVRTQNSDTSTTSTQFAIAIPTGTAEGDYLDTLVMSGKQVTTVPAGWTKVDEERDDAAFDVCWFTLLRKVAGPTEGGSQTVGFAGGCPWSAVTYRVPSSSQGRGTTAPNSIGHGSTGTQEINPTGAAPGSTVPTQGLTTTGPNRLGFFVVGARQVAGVSTGIDTSLLPAQGLSVLASTKTSTTGANFALVVATQVAATAGTLAAKTYKVVAGTGTNARWVSAQYAYLPETGNTTAGETLAATLVCQEAVVTP